VYIINLQALYVTTDVLKESVVCHRKINSDSKNIGIAVKDKNEIEL
jgi:hypothetical protein